MAIEKKIYSSWAFKENESEKAHCNREIYKELCEKYKISRYKVENPDDYDIVLDRTPGYNHSTYSVIKNNTETPREDTQRQHRESHQQGEPVL